MLTTLMTFVAVLTPSVTLEIQDTQFSRGWRADVPAGRELLWRAGSIRRFRGP